MSGAVDRPSRLRRLPVLRRPRAELAMRPTPLPPRYWTGPTDEDLVTPGGARLRQPVPPERWPYGPPEFHEDCCKLFGAWGPALFCDCKASDASDDEYGDGTGTYNPA